jgi:PIN domain nuclease of toxin-antitoxin system
VKLLLDTHSLIWSLTDNPTLSKEAKSLMSNLDENQIFVSAASIWEISIKLSLKRLEGIPNDFYEIM